LYVDRSHMVAFLNKRLCSGKTLLLLQFICVLQIGISSHHVCLKVYPKNILQHNLFIILESSGMVAQLPLCSIFFLTIIIPMHWLASNTFKLAHGNWGEKSLGRVIDLIYNAFVTIQSNGSLILDYNFMMGIFADLQREMPEFNTYMTWFFEEKECNTIGSSSKSQCVLSVDKGAEMLFYPNRICKQMNYAHTGSSWLPAYSLN
jgi:hypothetical protein